MPICQVGFRQHVFFKAITTGTLSVSDPKQLRFPCLLRVWRSRGRIRS